MVVDSIKAKNGGRPSIPNRQGLYSKAAKHADASIDTLVQLMSSRNENIRLGAAKALLNKCLPDLRAVDASVTPNEPLEVIIVSEEQHPN